MQNFKTAAQILMLDEGSRKKPYYDSKGFPTIGIGFRCIGSDGNYLPKNAPLPNITMPKDKQAEKLAALLQDYWSRIASIQPVFLALNDVRQAVILSMCHQMGVTGCVAFKGMWAAINSGDFGKAGDEIVDSQAGRDPDTASRMMRNRAMMQTGKLSTYYM